MSDSGGRTDRRRLWREVGLTWLEVWRLLDRHPPLSLLIVFGIAGLDEAASRYLEAMFDWYFASRPGPVLATIRLTSINSEAVRIILSVASTWLAYLIVFRGGPFPLPAGASIKSRPAIRLLVCAAPRWLLIIIGMNALRPIILPFFSLVWIALPSAPDAVSQLIADTAVVALLESGLVALLLWRLPRAVISNDRRSYTGESLSILFLSCLFLFETTDLINQVLLLVWHVLSWHTGTITNSLNSVMAVLLAFATYRRMQTTDPNVPQVFD